MQVSTYIKSLNATTFGKACAVFTDADTSSLKFAERLAQAGLSSRSEAKPYAMAWAAQKYGVQIEEGQRGHKLPQDSAAKKAMDRVLSVCFPGADNPFSGREVASKSPVEKLLAAYNKLTAGEKRSFKAALAKL